MPATVLPGGVEVTPQSGPASHPAVLEAVSATLPTPTETLFLRACLHSGASSRAALHAWWQRIGSTRESLNASGWGDRRLLPLVLESARREGVDLDPDLLSVLRAAYAHEQLRSESYVAACRDVLGRLHTAGIEVIVLPGAALAEAAYGDWALRHCGDLDLLVRDADLGPALAAISAGAARDPSGFVHPSGMPVRLHTRLFRTRYYRSLAGEAFDRRRPATIAGLPAEVLEPALCLVHVLVQAGAADPRSLRWVADAWQLIDRHSDLAWDAVRDTARRGRVTLPVSLRLEWLAAEIEAPCPPPVISGLWSDVAATGPGARDAALSEAVTAGAGPARAILRAGSGIRRRALLLRWLLLPSPEYVRATEPDVPVQLAYVARLARYAVRRVRSAARRIAGRSREGSLASQR